MVDTRRQELIQALPFARRFARALAGSQARGDVLVAKALAGLTSGEKDSDLGIRYGLYQKIIQCFAPDTVDGSAAADNHLDLNQRFLLLLTALEEVPLPAAARILGLDEASAYDTISKAHERLKSIAETTVLIIEDEPIIAMDIQDVVEQCGHRVAGVAHTESDAVRIAEETRPGLILADINLGGGGDGMQAVGRIMKNHQAPVVFVTAYPERLLTGEAEEPSFVITKPFEPVTLAITTYQAVTGGIKPI